MAISLKNRILDAAVTDPSSLAKKRLQKAFKFWDKDGYEYFQVDPIKDQPWRLKEKSPGVFSLSKAWRDRSWTPPKWYKKKEGTRDECYEYVIKFHNKNATPERGLGWKKI